MSFSVGIFGGSFDPVHNGHVKYAGFMCRKLELDKMIIVPAALSPFKNSAASEPEDRLSMCRLAFNDSVYEVSPFEIEKGGKSYSVDTVSYIKKLYPGARLFMSVGSDQFLKFRDWKRYGDILKNVTLCGVSREKGSLINDMEAYADKYLRPYGECLIFSFEPFIISSSEIRRAVSSGQDISAYVPENVAAYIKRKGLYR